MSSLSLNDTIDGLWQGSIDIHVHAGPDPVAARRQGILELARASREAGMRAIIFKSHEYPTAPVSSVVNQVVDGFTVYGSISLDNGVGGLNAEAVEWSAKMGAVKVWMPTYAADYWSSKYFKKPGIRVLSDDG